MAEQRPFKAWVEGSNPSWLTKCSRPVGQGVTGKMPVTKSNENRIVVVELAQRGRKLGIENFEKKF